MTITTMYPDGKVELIEKIDIDKLIADLADFMRQDLGIANLD